MSINEIGGYEKHKQLVIDIVNRAFLTQYTSEADIEIISDSAFSIEEQDKRVFYWKLLKSIDGQNLVWISEADWDRHFHSEAVWDRVYFSVPEMAIVRISNNCEVREVISCTVATPIDSVNYHIPTITVQETGALSVIEDLVDRVVNYSGKVS